MTCHKDLQQAGRKFGAEVICDRLDRMLLQASLRYCVVFVRGLGIMRSPDSILNKLGIPRIG